jgi:hypothetical protein
LREHGLPRRLSAGPGQALQKLFVDGGAVNRRGRDAAQLRRYAHAQAEAWRESQLSDAQAKLIIYRAFIESDLDVPKHLAKPVHEMYFNPQHEEFQARTMWSLSNAACSGELQFAGAELAAEAGSRALKRAPR